MAFSPDGRRLLTGTYDGRVRLWDVAERTCRELKRHGRNVTTVAFDPAGARAAWGSWDGTVCAWELAGKGKEVMEKRHGARVEAVRFTPGGKELLSGGRDGVLRVWSVATWSEVRAFPVGSEVLSLGLLKGRVVTGSEGWVKVWDYSTHELLLEAPEQPTAVGTVAPFIAGGRDYVLFGLEKEGLKLWAVGP